ncbi:hypothetical protein [Pedobacter sp. L105]|uniref:DUF6934 family protein n=1 Tax=Pedobacter sp. L105 TaxID=1641871 RepID=UPI00131C32D3|nr:hypothetical protein [Pedobacter sp. L105]
MNNERYQHITSSPDKSEFKFISEGKNGAIKKLIQYKKVHAELPDIYNLCFGNLSENGKSVDDSVRSNNGDMMKILTTGAFTVNEFISCYPDKIIYIRGSDPARTRLYQIAINKYFDEIIKNYELYGHVFKPATETSEEEDYDEPFQKNKNYYGFLVIRKI